MALIVITISDSAEGADIGVLCEPALDTKDPNAIITGAQQIAIAMLKVATGEAPVTKDRGLIALIN